MMRTIPSPHNDFGKNIIPAMLADGEKMVAYRFKGYWKDVGTIQSLWDANMDMLDVNNPNGINVYDKEWQIFARNPIRPPHMTGASAIVSDSLVTDGCKIYGDVEHSVLFHSVTVEKGATVKDSVIMPNTVIKAGAVVDHAIVAENAVVGVAAQVGVPTEGRRAAAWSWSPRASSVERRRRDRLTAPCAPNLRKVVTRNDHSAARHSVRLSCMIPICVS